MPYPTVILPGFFAGAQDYLQLQQDLEAENFPCRTVPLTVQSWLPTVGGRPMTPILAALDQTIRLTQTEFDSPKVNVIGHSAGGWIARIYLGDVSYYDRQWAGLDHVASLIALGTPHISQERWTRRNIDFVNDTYPGAFYPEVQYICVAGRSTLGQKIPLWQPQRWNIAQWLAYSSYKLTSGRGDCWGDGITPIAAAHLEGAVNLTLEGAYHSPRGDRIWYGSPGVRQHWIEYLQ